MSRPLLCLAGTVRATLRYTKRPPPGEHLFTYLYEKPADVSRTTNVDLEDHEVTHHHAWQPSPVTTPLWCGLLHTTALKSLAS